jgi:hypothetical protein
MLLFVDIGLFIIYLHMKYIPSSSDGLRVVAVRLKAKWMLSHIRHVLLHYLKKATSVEFVRGIGIVLKINFHI